MISTSTRRFACRALSFLFRPDRGEGDRDLAAARFVGFNPHLGPNPGQHLAQPRSGAFQSRFGRRQRPGVALEERDVGAVAADLDFDGQRAASSRTLQGLADQRRLAIPARRNEEDLLAGMEIPAKPVELDFAVDERRHRHDLSVNERVGQIGHGARGLGSGNYAEYRNRYVV